MKGDHWNWKTEQIGPFLRLAPWWKRLFWYLINPRPFGFKTDWRIPRAKQ